MSLTSYRAAPPRVNGSAVCPGGREIGAWGPGGDLLFRRLSGSTIGAEGFHGRVRDGIGCLAPRHGHQAGKALPLRSVPPVQARACPWLEQGGRLWHEPGVGGICNVTGVRKSVCGAAWAPAPCSMPGASFAGPLAPLVRGKRVLPLHAGGFRRQVCSAVAALV